MQFKNAALVLASLAAQRTLAQEWGNAGSFSCPGNTNNQCSDSQQGGYDWSGLNTGSFSQYGSNSFSGFSCSNSFGKRDLLSKRGFQSKCITGNLDDGPSMSCSDNDSMSIDTMQVSSSQDADVECHYGMPDGSTCVETHSCSQGGSIFQNTQCGGARSVTFKPGSNAPAGCSVGVHSVGFNCGSSSSSTPPATPSSTPITPASIYTTPSSTPSSPVTSTPTTTSTAPCYGGSCSSSTPVSPVSSSTPATPASTYTAPSSSASSAPCYGGSCSSSTPVSPTSSSSAPAPPCYGGSCSSSTPVSPVSSSTPSSYSPPSPSSSSTPVSPVSSSTPPSYSPPAPSSSSTPPTYPSTNSSSAPAPPCYGGSCSSSTPVSPVSSSTPFNYPTPSSSSTPVSPVSSSTPAPPAPSCPGLLPKCLNTWMFMSGCKDNADYNCFCANEQFIKNVMGCISAWSGSSSDSAAAVAYLQGVCANHVPTNPAIITACPSGVTPAAYTSTVTAGPTAPCSTITVSTSVTIPATYSTGVSMGFTIPASSYTTSIITTVTVPQVQITTSTVTAGGTTVFSTGLGNGTPSPPATTPAAPGPPPATRPASPVASPTGGLVCSEFQDGQPQCASATAAGTTPAAAPPAATTPANTAPPAGGAPPAYGSSVGAVGTTFGTSFAATPTASSSPIVPATGAGAKMSSGFAGLVLAAFAAFAAL